MGRKHYIIGTAGHIDHGKSTLIEALTGIDPDRLPEEKARGMTIDLGFALLELPDPTDLTEVFRVGIVDVPGHADFVKNMVAGVGSIDLALLVVAADDQWMPQTEEHLQILQYLGVRSAVVALTKSDLLDDPSSAIESIRSELLDTEYAGAPIVAVSALGDLGLDELRTALAHALKQLPEASDYGKGRLHIDRVFSPRGVGTVVTGTLTGGVLNKGETVVIQPSGLKSSIRQAQSHHKKVETALPGMRTALNLSDVSSEENDRKNVSRGQVVTLPGLGHSSDTMDVLIERSDREIPGQAASTRPLKNGQRIRWHHGAGSHSARVFFLGAKRTLLPGESCLAEIRFERPAYAFLGDRFVIRDWPKTSSLAGGVVLDPHANRTRFRTADQSAFLHARRADPESLDLAMRSLLDRDHALLFETILTASPYSAKAIAALAEALIEEGKALRSGLWLLDRSWWHDLVVNAASAIDEHHRKHRDHLGLPLSELRQHLASRLPDATLFDAVVKDLPNDAYIRAGKILRNRKHLPSLPPELRLEGERIRKQLTESGYEPPNPKELAPDPSSQKALRFLIETGEAIDFGDKCVLFTSTFDHIRNRIITHLRAHQRATVSELRQELGTTRRVLMPILERLDRESTTIRHEDIRMLSARYLRENPPT